MKNRRIPVVVTALRPPKPPGLNNNRRRPCLRTLARVSICDCDRLNVCLINCQSICNKAITIKDYIVDNSLDIILLCETWLTSEKEKKICGDCPKRNDWNCGQIRLITRGSHKITKSNPKMCKMYFTAQVSGSSKGSIEFVKYA